jgi:hypothetical protein
VPIQLAFDRRRMPAQLGGDPTHREAQPEQVGDLQPFPDIEVNGQTTPLAAPRRASGIGALVE